MHNIMMCFTSGIFNQFKSLERKLLKQMTLFHHTSATSFFFHFSVNAIRFSFLIQNFIWQLLQRRTFMTHDTQKIQIFIDIFSTLPHSKSKLHKFSYIGLGWRKKKTLANECTETQQFPVQIFVAELLNLFTCLALWNAEKIAAFNLPERKHSH